MADAKMTPEQIEAWRRRFIRGYTSRLTRDDDELVQEGRELNNLCDLALRSLDAQADVVTSSMIEAGKDERMECLKTDGREQNPVSVSEALTRIYLAMRAAAPQNAGQRTERADYRSDLSELEPDGTRRQSNQTDREGSRGNEVGRRDEVDSSGAQRGERADLSEVERLDVAVPNAPAQEPQPKVSGQFGKFDAMPEARRASGSEPAPGAPSERTLWHRKLGAYDIQGCWECGAMEGDGIHHVGCSRVDEHGSVVNDYERHKPSERDPFANVTEAEKHDAFEWLRAKSSGAQSLLREHVLGPRAAKALNAILGEQRFGGDLEARDLSLIEKGVRAGIEVAAELQEAEAANALAGAQAARRSGGQSHYALERIARDCYERAQAIRAINPAEIARRVPK